MKDFAPFEDYIEPGCKMSQNFCTNEAEWIEASFHQYLGRWQKINSWFCSHGFYDREDEIMFFKYIKPVFIGVLNYYVKRYHNLLFRPFTDIRHNTFYRKELRRSEVFLHDHAEFYSYYRNDCTERDNEYFRINLQHTLRSFDKLPGENSSLTSGKDRLATDIITHHLYRNYLMKLFLVPDASQEMPGTIK